MLKFLSLPHTLELLIHFVLRDHSTSSHELFFLPMAVELPHMDEETLGEPQRTMWLDSCAHFAIYLISSTVCTRYTLSPLSFWSLSLSRR